jgi:hypothetical protein
VSREEYRQYWLGARGMEATAANSVAAHTKMGIPWAVKVIHKTCG